VLGTVVETAEYRPCAWESKTGLAYVATHSRNESLASGITNHQNPRANAIQSVAMTAGSTLTAKQFFLQFLERNSFGLRHHKLNPYQLENHHEAEQPKDRRRWHHINHLREEGR